MTLVELQKRSRGSLYSQLVHKVTSLATVISLPVALHPDVKCKVQQDEDPGIGRRLVFQRLVLRTVRRRVRCTVSSPSNGYGCDGAWHNIPTYQMNRAGTSTKTIDFIPCTSALFLSAWSGPIPFLVGGGGGCMFDIMWPIHVHDGMCKPVRVATTTKVA